jgi:spore germination protein KA
LTDGTPFALIVPVTIIDLLHTPEDSALRWQFGTFLRAIRLFAIFVSNLLPGLYVALTNFHREMLPTDLLIAIAKARENVPFPTIAEVLLMELSFELIREAGIRIPGIIGNTIGIIGALILGQAAVQANLVSPVMIIIVAFTGLGNFAIPDFNLAFGARLMRIFYIFAGASFGFYGISLAILVSLAFMVSLNSFGVPLFSTLAPKTHKSYDLFLRWPSWKQERRPDYLNPLDITRQPKVSRKWAKAKPYTGGRSGGAGKSGKKDGSDEQ